MYGADVDELNVKLRYYEGGDVQVDPGAAEFLVWSLKGDQGQGWKYAQVSKKAKNNNRYISILSSECETNQKFLKSLPDNLIKYLFARPTAVSGGYPIRAI